jgi:hypothetical protein
MNTKMRKVGLGLLGLILVVTLILMNVNIKVGPQSEDSNLALTVTVGDTVNAAGIIPDVVGVNSAAVQAALNLVATTGGEVSLISPVYTFTGTVSRAIPNVVFKLNGATITNNASTPLFSAGSQSGWAFYDGKLDAGGITLTSATDYSLNNITIGTTYYAFKTSGTSTVGNITATTGNITTLSGSQATYTTGNITTLNAPTGRTASYVIASATYGSAQEKAQADLVTDDMVAGWNAAVGTFPSYTFLQTSTGTTIVGKIGTIRWGSGLYTSSSQWSIPNGYDITMIGSAPGNYSPPPYVDTPLPYMGGTQFYFTGTTYPVFNVPLSTGETLPSTGISLTDIAFVVKNPAAQQVNTVFAFNLDGWHSGIWRNVYWLSDVAVYNPSTPVNPWQTANIKGLSAQPGYDFDRLYIESMTVSGFQTDMVTFDANQLEIGTLTLACYSQNAAGDNGYGLVAKRFVHINVLQFSQTGKGIYVAPTNYSGVVIDTMRVENMIGTPWIANSGPVHITNLESYQASMADIPFSTFSNATVDKAWYSQNSYGGRVNSTQGVGMGAIKTVDQLQAILGDTRGLWACTEGSGTTVKDYSTKSHNLTASKDLHTFDVLPLIKGNSGVYSFKGADTESLMVADSSDFTFGNGSNDSPFSVIAVINKHTTSDQIIISKAAVLGAASGKEWWLDTESSGKVCAYVSDKASNGNLHAITDAALTNDTWYVLIVTYDGSGSSTGLKIYINGVLPAQTNAETGTYTAMNNTTADLYIARPADVYGYYEGKGTWFSVTAKELNPQEVFHVTQILSNALELTPPTPSGDYSVNIKPGEIRTASGSLTAGNANAIGFSWHNPEAQDIFISKVIVEVTTPGGTALSVLQVGIADDATGTNLGAEYFTGLDLNSAAICDSWNATQTGAQTGLLTLQDSASATDGWIVGKILTQNAASLAGKYYIFYVGK